MLVQRSTIRVSSVIGMMIAVIALMGTVGGTGQQVALAEEVDSDLVEELEEAIADADEALEAVVDTEIKELDLDDIIGPGHGELDDINEISNEGAISEAGIPDDIEDIRPP